MTYSLFQKQQSNFITKCDRLLLESVPGITKCDRLLLQSASDITKCDRYYQKVRQVLQSVIVITNTAQKIEFSIKDFFSKCVQIRSKLRI